MEKTRDDLSDAAVLGKLLIRLYGWMIILQTKGLLNHVLKSLGLIEKPLRILYSYPAIVIGMTYVLLPFMILSVYSSAEKLDWSLVEAARDLGASLFKAFWTVSFKLTLPGLLSGVILTFIPSMDCFSSQISWVETRSCLLEV